MNASAKRQRARRGFTLVELLTVVVIIGILASLITAAAIMARTAALNAAVAVKISDVSIAVESYKSENREYPPDFTDQNVVRRHLRTVFPHYAPNGDPYAQMVTDLQNFYSLDPGNFDPASALVFWLGGLPQVAPGVNDPWMPAGFHADPASPFKPGLPRIKPVYQFNPEEVRMQDGSGWLRIYPRGTERGPLVYFRARKSLMTGLSGYDGVVGYTHNGGGLCVPYLAPGNNTWRNQNTFQIIHAGMDGQFASSAAGTTRVSKTFAGFTDADYDNITNFSSGTLEDETE